MPRLSDNSYAFYGEDEHAANIRFNEYLDQGYGVMEAAGMAKADFPSIPDELIEWWCS